MHIGMWHTGGSSLARSVGQRAVGQQAPSGPDWHSGSMARFQKILELGQASGSLSEQEQRQLPKLVEVVKALLQEKARGLAGNAAGRLLRPYSSDGPPLKVKQRVVARSGEQKVIRAWGATPASS